MSELDDYDYELPPELIAQEPLPQRADSRLLVVRRATGEIQHRVFRDLGEYLRPGDALVLNDTRVVPARLVGYKAQTSGRWEGLYLSSDDQGRWRLICRSRGKLKPGEPIVLVDPQGRACMRLILLNKDPRGVWTAVPESAAPACEILDAVGRVPLPPYIRGGEMVPADRQRYQTVYARQPGSAAAPTAGLHFTEPLLAALEKQGVARHYVTLHVGLDTFRPLQVERLDEHRMHREWCRLDPPTAEALVQCRRRGGRIVAVGTTSVRVLETAAASGALAPFSGETELFIRAGHRFRAVDAMITNFHLPRSTLLILVHALAGDALMRRAYETAIAERYRFFSYGDAMFIE